MIFIEVQHSKSLPEVLEVLLDYQNLQISFYLCSLSFSDLLPDAEVGGDSSVECFIDNAKSSDYEFVFSLDVSVIDEVFIVLSLWNFIVKEVLMDTLPLFELLVEL